MTINHNRIELLSYPVADGMPVYGGKADIELSQVNSISRGDSANTFTFRLNNHWGTHIDAPNHFFDIGAKITEYPIEYFLFKTPNIISLRLNEGQLVSWEDVNEKIEDNCDLLIFHSDWGDVRGREEYAHRNPGIHKDVGFQLRDKYPSVKAIMMDWISLSSRLDRKMGGEAHRAFLDPNGVGDPILLVEDANLSVDLTGLLSVQVVPLMVNGVDSVPCSVLGYFDD